MMQPSLHSIRPFCRFRPLHWLVLLCVPALLAGCATGGSKGVGSSAGVTIAGHSVTDVVLTTRDVFAGHGFVLKKAETDRMIFERPGSRADQVKFGSFSSPGVTIRAKVDLQDMGAKKFYLRCDVFSVRDAGDSILEDETKILMISTKQYQKIMEEIKARLDGTTGSASKEA